MPNDFICQCEAIATQRRDDARKLAVAAIRPLVSRLPAAPLNRQNLRIVWTYSDWSVSIQLLFSRSNAAVFVFSYQEHPADCLESCLILLSHPLSRKASEVPHNQFLGEL